jgi:hypothetical protein
VPSWARGLQVIPPGAYQGMSGNFVIAQFESGPFGRLDRR